jgi:hypothetical protein
MPIGGGVSPYQGTGGRGASEKACLLVIPGLCTGQAGMAVVWMTGFWFDLGFLATARGHIAWR